MCLQGSQGHPGTRVALAEHQGCTNVGVRPRHLPNPFIRLPDHAYEASLANIEMEGQSWPAKLYALGGLEPSILP